MERRNYYSISPTKERNNSHNNNNNNSHNNNNDYNDSNTINNMPKSIIDRLLSRKTRYNTNIEMNEDNIERILHKAASDGGYDLDFSGALLENDSPFFIIDIISHYNYYKFAHINLNNTKISLRGFDALTDSIICFNDLKTLTLRGNLLPKEAGMSIAKILGARATLQVLDLRENNLSDAGLAAISGAFTADLTDLPLNTTVSLLTLTILDISNNSIGDSGLLSLCRGLSHFAKSFRSVGRNSSLQVLRLSNNKIGDKAAVCLAQFLETYYCTGYYALEEITLSNNPIGHTGLIAILSSIQSATNDAATLIKLGLDGCKPNIEVLDEITRLLRQPTTSKIRIIELAMEEEEAMEICLNDSYLDAIVALSDAVKANDHITILTLGELPDVTRKQVLASQPGSARYYGLRVAMDCFSAMIEVLKLQSNQQRALLSSLEQGQPVSILKLQQNEFEKLRKEHASVFHELSEEIRKLPLLAGENQQMIENNGSFDFYQPNTFRIMNSNNDYDNTNNLGGTGSSINSNNGNNNNNNNNGEFYGNNMNINTNQLHSAPESPIRSQSPTRVGRDNSPFIPRSSTNRLMTSASPFRRSNQQDSMNNNNNNFISTEQLSDIIKDAVSNALETAQNQWIKELKNGTFTHPDFAGSENFQHRFTQLSSKVDILQDQVQGLDAQAFNLIDKMQYDELYRSVMNLDGRVNRLEQRLDQMELKYSTNYNELYKNINTDRDVVLNRFTSLIDRINSLETAVESEHETSLDLLEVLLHKNEKNKSKLLTNSHKKLSSSLSGSGGLNQAAGLGSSFSSR